MKQGEHEWCMACDGEGMIEERKVTKRVCDQCGGLGCIKVNEEQLKRDRAEAAKLQATVDEVKGKR